MKTGDSSNPLPRPFATAALLLRKHCSRPATPIEEASESSNGSQFSLLGRRISTSTGESPPSVLRNSLFCRTAKSPASASV